MVEWLVVRVIVDWLVGWVGCSLVEGLFGWLTEDRLMHYLIDFFLNEMVGRLIGFKS